MLSRFATYIDTVGWRRRYRSFAEGWPSRSRAGIQFVRTRKAQYRFRCSGSGQALVFLADGPVMIEAYDELLEVFDPHYRVIVVEAAATGFSAANNGYGFGFQESSDDMAEMLSRIGVTQAILAFSCVGGLGAVDIAVRHPNLVSSLFLLQTTNWSAFMNWKARRDPKGLLGKPFVGQLGMKKLAKARAPVWLELAVGRKDCIPALCACCDQGFEHGMAFPLASFFQRYLIGPDPLGIPSQPIRIVWGMSDGSHDVISLEGARALAPQAQVIAIDGLGHFPELEDPRRILEILRETCASGA